jgi:hypothetical protein
MSEAGLGGRNESGMIEGPPTVIGNLRRQLDEI